MLFKKKLCKFYIKLIYIYIISDKIFYGPAKQI